MAVEKKTKRKNKRKSRTEAISSSSSSPSSSSSSSSDTDSDSSAQSPPPPRTTAKPQDKPSNSAITSQPETQQPPAPATLPTWTTDAETAFTAFYLSRTTHELSNDLDSLRSAKDFDAARSVPLLIAALKQGTACFNEAERRMIGSATAVVE